DCGVAPEILAAYRALDARGELPSRVNVMPLRRVDGVAAPVPLPERFVSDRLRVDTAKFLADGGLSGATAALSVSYRHAPHKGVLRFDHDELAALCRETHAAGWRIAAYAIGDVAIDEVLGIYESLGPHPRRQEGRERPPRRRRRADRSRAGDYCEGSAVCLYDGRRDRQRRRAEPRVDRAGQVGRSRGSVGKPARG